MAVGNHDLCEALKAGVLAPGDRDASPQSQLHIKVRDYVDAVTEAVLDRVRVHNFESVDGPWNEGPGSKKRSVSSEMLRGPGLVASARSLPPQTICAAAASPGALRRSGCTMRTKPFSTPSPAAVSTGSPCASSGPSHPWPRPALTQAPAHQLPPQLFHWPRSASSHQLVPVRHSRTAARSHSPERQRSQPRPPGATLPRRAQLARPIEAPAGWRRPLASSHPPGTASAPARVPVLANTGAAGTAIAGGASLASSENDMSAFDLGPPRPSSSCSCSPPRSPPLEDRRVPSQLLTPVRPSLRGGGTRSAGRQLEIPPYA